MKPVLDRFTDMLHVVTDGHRGFGCDVTKGRIHALTYFCFSPPIFLILPILHGFTDSVPAQFSTSDPYLLSLFIWLHSLIPRLLHIHLPPSPSSSVTLLLSNHSHHSGVKGSGSCGWWTGPECRHLPTVDLIAARAWQCWAFSGRTLPPSSNLQSVCACISDVCNTQPAR